MGRKPGNQSAVQSLEGIQNGGIVWVLYRKKAWPVKVKRVYMKTKKITYNFLPIKNHPNVFSVEMKNVRAFKATDKLPSDGSKEQQDAYEIALKMLNGEYTDDDDNQSDFGYEDEAKDEVENEIKEAMPLSKKKKVEPKRLTIKLNVKKSTKATDSLNSKKDSQDLKANLTTGSKKLPIKTKTGSKRLVESSESMERDGLEEIKSAVKKNDVEESSDCSENDIEDDQTDASETSEKLKAKVLFKKNVAKSKIKSNEVKNVTDPETDNNGITNKNVDIKKITKKHVFKCGDVVAVHTEVGMWPAIITKKLNEREVTNKIFPLENSPEESKIDTQHFVPFPVDNLDKMIEDSKDKPSLFKALQSVKHYLQKQNNNLDKESDSKDKVETKSKREERANAKLLKEQAKKKTNDETSNEKHTKKTDVVEKKNTEKKKLKIDTDNNLKNNDSEESSKKLGKSQGNRNERFTEEPNSDDTDYFQETDDDEKFKSRKRECSNSLSNDSSNKRQREQPSAMENKIMTEMDLKKKKTIKDNEIVNKKEKIDKEIAKTKSETTKSKLPFFLILLSDKVKNHLNSIWTNKIVSKRHDEYVKPKDILDLQFNFNCGNLLTLEELNKALTEIHGWIALCTRIPPMNLIFEYHYIANVVLPEACIYALSEFDNISLAESESKFLSLVEQKQKSYDHDDSNSSEKKHLNGSLNVEKIPIGSLNTTLNQQERTAAFQDLLLAATIMQDKEKNQNGTDLFINSL